MNSKDIKKLIDAFYEGETSVEEEKIIFDYFLNESIEEDMKEEQAFFLSLSQSVKPIRVPESLESKLSSLIEIDDLNDKEKKKKSKIHNIWIGIASTAACVIIILSIGLQLNQNKNEQMAIEAKDTFNDPNEAYKEVEKALLLVSNNMNKGIDQLSVISNNIDKTSDIFNKSIKK